jgi:PD-(D/E)XK nuclease superfamily protein
MLSLPFVAMLTTNEKGFFAEAAVIKEAARLGIQVSRPLADARYDLVLEHGDVVVIRCRTCRRGRDGLIHGAYNADEIDAIAGYCADLDLCYLLPLELSVGRRAVQLRLAPSRNNQRAGINWARDFEFGATLSRLHGPIAQLGERQSGTLEAAGSSPAGSTDSEAA